MERCPHCGAATRPGAKFCTSCGTRLDDQAGTPSTVTATTDAEEPQLDSSVSTAEDTDHETESAIPEPNWAAATTDDKEETTGTDDGDASPAASDPTAEDTVEDVPATEGSSWFSKWPDSTTRSSDSDSPADRLREALGTDEPATEGTDSPEPVGQAFPERSSWSWGTSAEETADQTEESVMYRPAAAAEDTSDESSVPEAQESGDAIPTASSGDGDARKRASDLVDELRGLIWQIGTEEPAGDDAIQTIINNMKRVRGETGDFSDLRSVIEAVREHPRDIDALRDLGAKADRLQALLDSHTALTTALEEAIKGGSQ